MVVTPNLHFIPSKWQSHQFTRCKMYTYNEKHILVQIDWECVCVCVLDTMYDRLVQTPVDA